MVLRGLLAIGVIAALVASGFFYKDSLDQNKRVDSISAQIKNSTNMVTVVTNQTKATQVEVSDFTKSLADAQAAIAAEKEKMPVKMNSNEIVRKVMLTGGTANVTVIPLSTDEWAAAKVDKGSYFVFKMNIEISGEQEQVVEFIKRLQSDLYPTLVIESVNIKKNLPPASPVATPIPVTTGGITAELRLAVYAR